MAEIVPLTPLRYDLTKLTKGNGFADVVAPPYDVIDDVQRAALAAKSPYNIVKLILPEGEGAAKYQNARDLFTAWRNDRVLVRDDEPAFYRYAQTFTPPGGGRKITRRGFLGLVKVAPYEDKVVLPHERTLSGPKEDRFNLFKATKTNFSPGFQLYADPQRALDAAIDSASPLVQFTTEDGIAHDLGKVTSREAIKAIAGGVAKSTLLIADGHHRYETALRYKKEVPNAGVPRAESDYFLVFFANGDDPDLLVFPTHRHVHSLATVDFARLEGVLSGRAAGEGGAAGIFDVTELSKDADANVYTDALAKAGKTAPSLVACAPDGRALLLSLKKDADLGKHPVLGKNIPELRRTDVALLHSGILEPVLGITPAMQAAKSNIWYPQDASATLRDLRGGKGQVLFLMNGTPVKQVRDVAEAGEVMPQKSTFFFPKVLTGLCIHTLEPDRSVPAV